MAGLQVLSNIKMNGQPRITRHSRKINPLRDKTSKKQYNDNTLKKTTQRNES